MIHIVACSVVQTGWVAALPGSELCFDISAIDSLQSQLSEAAAVLPAVLVSGTGTAGSSCH